MNPKTIFLISLIVLQGIWRTNSQCNSEILIADETLTSGRIYTYSQLPNAPSPSAGMTDVTISGYINLVTFTGALPNPISLLKFKYIDTATNTLKSAIELKFLVSIGNQAQITAQDQSINDRLIASTSIPSMYNTAIWFSGSVSLSKDQANGGFLYFLAKSSSSSNPPTFSSGATFDSNSVLEICMGDAGNYEISCEIKDLTILYNTLQPSQHQLHLNQPIQIGNYKLLEGTGTTLESSINTMGAATLGTPGQDNTIPKWTSESTLSFTTGQEYIDLPEFAFAEDTSSLYVSRGSITISFWMKLKGASSTNAFVFDWQQATPIMSIQITPSNEVETRFPIPNANVKKHTAPLVFDKWTFVSATFSYVKVIASGMVEVTINIIVGTNSSTFISYTVAQQTLPKPVPSAVFRIGGSPSFIGEISTINFYNPGGVIQPQSCLTSSCPVMFGLENPPLCLLEPCNEGYYQPRCEKCPQGCKNCDSATFCTECIAGFILANDLCDPCPDGKYWSAPQTCLDCAIDNCLKCPDASTCTKCAVPYVLENNNKCSPTCGVAQCETCPDALTCTKCKSGYDLINPTECKSTIRPTGEDASLLSDGEIAGLAVGVTAFIGVILFGVVKLISLKSATATAATTVAGKTTSTASQLPNVETKVDIVSPTIENQPLNINQVQMKNFI